jgi:ribonuclease Y
MDQFEIMWIIISFGVGGVIAFLLKGKMASHRLKAAKSEAEKVIRDAQQTSETLLKEANLEAKDRLFKMKSDFDRETKETRLELKKD